MKYYPNKHKLKPESRTAPLRFEKGEGAITLATASVIASCPSEPTDTQVQSFVLAAESALIAAEAARAEAEEVL